MDDSIHHTRRPDGTFCLTADQWVPSPIDEVFEFFSNAHNLEALTPDLLEFKVLTPAPIAMFPGALIDYRLRVHGIPLRWRTEITEWDPPHGFVDTQLKGPYTLWHHTHRFETEGEGTRCRDTVLYRVFGGRLIQSLFVGRDVEAIFTYRQSEMRSRFGNAA
ncbi:MAG: SRPBCC family protein [Myxococcota bacterium]